MTLAKCRLIETAVAEVTADERNLEEAGLLEVAPFEVTVIEVAVFKLGLLEATVNETRALDGLLPDLEPIAVGTREYFPLP